MHNSMHYALSMNSGTNFLSIKILPHFSYSRTQWAKDLRIFFYCIFYDASFSSSRILCEINEKDINKRQRRRIKNISSDILIFL